MSLRTFTDAQGVEWHAFDVIPREMERRRYDRRSSGEVQLSPEEEADRREEDRRLTVGRAGLLRRSDGWLCFEHGTERRRLAPIPEDWVHAPDAALEEYCRHARPVKPVNFAKR